MKLLRFRVQNFRSIVDSGWVETDQVTAFIGVNESGKTNALLPLWKLNPARNGEVVPTQDFPRKSYTELREREEKPFFITAQFEAPSDLVDELVQLTGAPADQVKVIQFARRLDGKRTFTITFPDADVPATLPTTALLSALRAAREAAETANPSASADIKRKEAILAAVDAASNVAGGGNVSLEDATALCAGLTAVKLNKAAAKLDWIAFFSDARLVADALAKELRRPSPGGVKEARQAALKRLPKFVYYSNYGNLDSEIYLPHVIENMEREDLGLKGEARVRTLRVLFEYVRLSPQEILELGRESSNPNNARLTDAQIETDRERKKERDILLQSASADLTTRFREWWKQGEYRFRFSADGNHFRIWVADDLRPEDIELEGRSTGLQWFLSFYLVFLVESQGEHKNTILLLDEPGLSLHPIAQRALSEFFDGLAEKNQILYTTHSPFLVDADRLDRVKVVYVDDGGDSKVSADLRITEKKKRVKQSLYPVNAAIGISASEAFLLGSIPVIVEGPSDQHHLSAIKNYLIGQRLLSPPAEVIFIPADGVRGVKAIASIVAGPNEQLPVVLLDGDAAGVTLASNLKGKLYASCPERVLLVSDFTDRAGDEVEDLWPPLFLAKSATRLLRKAVDYFEDEVVDTEGIVEQIEGFAKRHGIDLDPGWKVELAKLLRPQLERHPGEIGAHTGTVWAKLFAAILDPKASCARGVSC